MLSMRKENKHDVREQRLDNIDKSTFTVLTANEDSLEPHVFRVVGAVMVSTAMSSCTQTWWLLLLLTTGHGEVDKSPCPVASLKGFFVSYLPSRR